MKVSVEVLQSGRIRLRWYYQGKQCVLSPGTRNSPITMAYGRSETIASAKQLAALIESDILSHNYDPTLLKYRPRTGPCGTMLPCAELWRRYTKAMATEKGLSPSALGRYRAISSHLQTVVGDLACDKLTVETFCFATLTRTMVLVLPVSLPKAQCRLLGRTVA